MMQARQRDFFISYNNADRQWAEWIAWQLEDAGYTTFIQAWDFRPGSNFVIDMQAAISRARRTIAVLSPNYLKSGFTQAEWAAAFAHDPTGHLGLLVPVRICECDPKGLLPQVVYVDLVGLDETSARDCLLCGVNFERAKPIGAPVFPITGADATITPTYPARKLSVWNVPFTKNQNFTGREDLLEELSEKLAKGHVTALTQTAAVHGLGGIGKTQIAIEYCFRYKEKYDFIWWIRAEESASIAADLAALGQRIGFPLGKDIHTAGMQVKQWLETQSNWLLVFDNVQRPGDVYQYLPQGRGGHVIITSRDPNWRETADVLLVGIMEETEVIDFLIRRTGRNERVGAAELARELGFLPLALEQAAAYIEQTGCDYKYYLALFRDHRQELRKRGKPVAYEYTVDTTWDLSFEVVRKEEPVAAELLGICAFLAGESIPERLLQNTVEDRLKYNDAIAALRRHSLIQVKENEGILSVHRLVQQVVRDRLSNKQARVYAKTALNLVYKEFAPDEGAKTWANSTLLLPHALEVIGYAEKRRLISGTTARLQTEMGRFQHTGGGNFVKALVASSCFIGNFPVAPGTITSLFTLLPSYYLCRSNLWPLHLLVIVVLFFVGVPLATDLERIWGKKDSRRITIDELVGTLITFLLNPVSTLGLWIGLILWRFFDVAKPLFIGRLTRLPGGWGVMLDDVLAGVYANVLLRTLIFLLPVMRIQ